MKAFYDDYENSSKSFFKSKSHVALLSRKHELNYLREMCRNMLPLVLPDTYLNK